MTRLARLARDQFLVSVVVLGALGAAGFVFLWLAWRTSARLTPVAGQLPYLASAGMAGVATVAFAAGIFGIQLRRRAEARRRASYDRVIDAAAEVVAAMSTDPRLGP